MSVHGIPNSNAFTNRISLQSSLDFFRISEQSYNRMFATANVATILQFPTLEPPISSARDQILRTSTGLHCSTTELIANQNGTGYVIARTAHELDAFFWLWSAEEELDYNRALSLGCNGTLTRGICNIL